MKNNTCSTPFILSLRSIVGIGCLSLLSFIGFTPDGYCKSVKYELTATRGSVNLSGKRTVDFALLLNGSIPAPTLEFTEGDEAEIVVRNQIPDEELSIHWHGILLPPEMDGVPYVNTPPIFPGQSFTFKFPIRQSGTYWYHSHTNVQEQKGLYGGIVIHPRTPTLRVDRDLVVVLSDWTDEDATKVLKNLRKDGDYYQYKKGSVRSWWGAIMAGQFGTYVANEWNRMGGMDLSDVGYDAFLINGKIDSWLTATTPPERIRIRIINAAASTYFYVAIGDMPLRVIAADGIDIEPRLAQEILIGMAETYDVLFEANESKRYELRATAQDGTGYTSAWLGQGERVPAPTKPKPDLYAPMEHSSHGADQGGSHTGDHESSPHSSSHATPHPHPPVQSVPSHDSHQDPHAGHSVGHSAEHWSGHHPNVETKPSLPVVETLGVDQIRATKSTEFAATSAVHEVKFVLDGDMERYVWHLNGKAIHEDRTIEIRENDVVRFTFVNESMMHHPMHLHGHFFRVINEFGPRSPLKHTVDVPPHGTRTIEFKADEPGEWMLHCHNLYHLKTGMARVVKYSSYTPSPELAHLQKHDPHLHDHWYTYGQLAVTTLHAEAYLRASQTWNQVETRLELSRHGAIPEWQFNGELLYRRWFGTYFNLIGGGALAEERPSLLAGASLVLPLMIETTAWIDHHAQIQVGLEKRFQWTSSFLTDVEFKWRPRSLDEKIDWKFTLMFSPTWSWAAGLLVENSRFGAGVQIQF